MDWVNDAYHAINHMTATLGVSTGAFLLGVGLVFVFGKARKWW